LAIGVIPWDEDGPAEEAYAADQFFRGFKHHDLLTGGHADNCIGSGLNLVDQIGIQNDRSVIEASYLDHDCFSHLTSAVWLKFRENMMKSGLKEL
jgi:hypothetical protein